jgi:hypothetical protein
MNADRSSYSRHGYSWRHRGSARSARLRASLRRDRSRATSRCERSCSHPQYAVKARSRLLVRGSTNTRDRVTGLEAGADCVSAECSERELLSRVLASVRRLHLRSAGLGLAARGRTRGDRATSRYAIARAPSDLAYKRNPPGAAAEATPIRSTSRSRHVGLTSRSPVSMRTVSSALEPGSTDGGRALTSAGTPLDSRTVNRKETT